MQARPYIPLLLIVAVLAVHGRISLHEFAGPDDHNTLYKNPHFNPPSVHGVVWYWTHPAESLYIPLTYTVWGTLAAVAQLDIPDDRGITLNPWVFHLASLAVHALAVLGVFALLRKLGQSPWPAAAGALLFGLHPVQVETVAWASGLKDLLATAFLILALLGYCRFWTDSSRRWTSYGLGLLALLAALLSKPSAVVGPFLAAIVGWLVLRKPWRQVLLSLLPWLVLALVFGVIAKQVQPGEGLSPVAWWARPLLAGEAMVFYLGKLLWPFNLAPFYDRWPELILARGSTWWLWLVPLALGVALWIGYRRGSRIPAIAALLLLAALLPVLGLVSFHYQYYSTTADHYLYPAMIGVGLLLAWAAGRLGRYGGWVAAALLAALAIRSFHQAGYWADGLRLNRHAIAVSPRGFANYHSLGIHIAHAGRLDEAAGYFQKAIGLRPDYVTAYEQLAKCYALMGRSAEAVAPLTKLVELRARYARGPQRTELRVALGQALLEMGQYDAAVEQLELALAADPASPQISALLRKARMATQPASGR